MGSWGAPVFFCLFVFKSLLTKPLFLADSFRASFPPCLWSRWPRSGTPEDNTGSVTTEGGKEPLAWNVPDFTEEESEQTRLVSFSLLFKASGSE